MGYLSCRAESSISTCRSVAAVAPSQTRSNKKRKKKLEGPPSTHSDSTQLKRQADGDAGEADEDREADDGRRHIEHFTYAELESATSNFSDSSLLGRGSHGSVYRAALHRSPHRPSVVAVKRPSPRPALSPPSSNNEVENEIEILSEIRSPRLVNLIGFTHHSHHKHHQRLLVVEFMPNGTLYDFLHTNPRPPGWPRRLRHALQTAKALVTLHSAKPPVIHRDIKSANILIDRSFNARLGDFGLALRLDDSAASAALPSSCRSTPPAGTLGYLDPCYVTPDDLSTKTDVFSFGILLLEIMSGRKAIDVAYSPPSVVEWAVPLLMKGKVVAIYDPRIPPPKDSRVRRQLAVLAASCVRSSNERRPAMEEVVGQLKALSKAVNASAKAWNGLSAVNPCSMVDTEGTLLKINGKENSAKPRGGTGRREEAMPVGIKKPPLPPVPANSSVVKSARPLMKGEKVILDTEAKKSVRNLKELMARPAKLGKMLIYGAIFNCLDPILTVVAGLSVRDPFLTPFDKKDLADSAKSQFSCRDYSDHLALIRAYEGWKDAEREHSGYEYCWKNFLSTQTLKAIDSLKKQFTFLLKDTGLVDDNFSTCNKWSRDENLIRAVICAGLYPGVCSVVNKEKSISFKTMEDGQVMLYSNSVNGREAMIPYPWLVFNEKVKVNSVFLRDSTAISDTVLLLFGGDIIRGGLDGHLKMLGGYLEFFMRPDLASTYLGLKRELDELIHSKLLNPRMDIQTSEGLLTAIRMLVTEDPCSGRFVFGRQELAPKKTKSMIPANPRGGGDNAKSQLQTLLTRAGHGNPIYKTKPLKTQQFRATVEFNEMQFVGQPCGNKKLAEMDAAAEALEWLAGGNTSGSRGMDAMSMLLKQSKKKHQRRA